jgi:hypothetical protein
MRSNELREAYHTRLREGETVYLADAFGDNEPMAAKKARYLGSEGQTDPRVEIILDAGTDTLGQSFHARPTSLFTPLEFAQLLERHNPLFMLETRPLDSLLAVPEMNREFASILVQEAINREVAIELSANDNSSNS